MSKKRKELSHAEIWDDRALVNSWNEALAEYKYYHSLHARGEKIEDVLRVAEAAEQANGTEADALNGKADDQGWEEGERQDYEYDDEGEDHDGVDDEMTGGNQGDVAVDDSGEEITKDSAPEASAATSIVPPPDLPQALIGNTQDDTMKNIMMSWYYAGYYTGLHEGQKQAALPNGDTSGTKQVNNKTG